MRAAAALVLAPLVLACNDAVASRADPVAGTLLVSTSSGYDAPARLVVRDDAAWAAAWATLHALEAPVPARPAVDFGRDMLLVVAMGTRPSGGYRIVVADVTTGQGAVRATVVEESPGAGCVTTTALTQPVTVVRVAASAAPVDFVDEARTVDCR